MALVNMDEEVYQKAKEFVKQDRIKYPTVKNFIDKIVLEKINKVEETETQKD